LKTVAKKKVNEEETEITLKEGLILFLSVVMFLATVGFVNIGATIILMDLGATIFLALFIAGLETVAISFFVFVGICALLKKYDEKQQEGVDKK